MSSSEPTGLQWIALNTVTQMSLENMEGSQIKTERCELERKEEIKVLVQIMSVLDAFLGSKNLQPMGIPE